MSSLRTTIKAVLIANAMTTVMLSAVPAFATTAIFATFSTIGSNKNVRFVDSGTARGSISGPLHSTAKPRDTAKGLADVRFSFLQGPLSNVIVALPAKFELDAQITSTPITTYTAAGTEIFAETDITGFFEFTTAHGMTIDNIVHDAGTVLLRGDFSLARAKGTPFAANAGFGGGFGGNVAYSSPFLDFSNVADMDFDLNLDGIAASMAAPGTALRPFRAIALGSFRAKPDPVIAQYPPGDMADSSTFPDLSAAIDIEPGFVRDAAPGLPNALDPGNFSANSSQAVSAVPEPEVWGMLIIGFGLIGFQARRRGRTAVPA